MQTYNTADLYNKYVQEQAAEAFEAAYIGADSYRKILESHPSRLYTPNYFIRIALGLLTAVAILFCSLLTGLLFSTFSSEGMVGLCIFGALACYTALEAFVKSKRYYNAGMDNILMTGVVVFVAGAFLISDLPFPYRTVSAVLTLLCAGLSVRFTDAFMAVLAYLSFFVFFFLLYTGLGTIASATAPFVMMGFSAAFYFLVQKLQDKKGFAIYRAPYKAVSLFTLLTFYASANYFVVWELRKAMFFFSASAEPALPFGVLFWILTFAIPPLFIVYGIRKKDVLLIRTGLALVAVAVLTVRHYRTLLPLEMAMLWAGVILLGLSYALIRYLQRPRFGFIFKNTGAVKKERLNVEALIIAQTFGAKTEDQTGFRFGGGSGGGAGATGDY